MYYIPNKDQETREDVKSNRFQKLQKIFNGSRHDFLITVKEFSVLIITVVCVLAFEIVSYGTVEAAPFPAGHLFANQDEVPMGRSFMVGSRLAPLQQKQHTNRVNQGFELSSFVSTDSKMVADKNTNKNTNGANRTTNKTATCQLHPEDLLLLFIINVISGVAFGYLITKFWYWFAYSNTICHIYDFFMTYSITYGRGKINNARWMRPQQQDMEDYPQQSKVRNKMSLREDFKRPLDEVENVYLRRGALIIMSLVMIPVILLMGVAVCVFYGISLSMKEVKLFTTSIWNGKKYSFI